MRLICEACAASVELDLEKVIARRGEDFPITAVAATISKPCRCGALKWVSRPAWPHVVGQGARPQR